MDTAARPDARARRGVGRRRCSTCGSDEARAVIESGACGSTPHHLGPGARRCARSSRRTLEASPSAPGRRAPPATRCGALLDGAARACASPAGTSAVLLESHAARSTWLPAVGRHGRSSPGRAGAMVARAARRPVPRQPAPGAPATPEVFEEGLRHVSRAWCPLPHAVASAAARGPAARGALRPAASRPDRLRRAGATARGSRGTAATGSGLRADPRDSTRSGTLDARARRPRSAGADA